MSDYVQYWRRDSVSQCSPGERLGNPGSNQYQKLEPGDRVWVVALDEEGLYLFAKIGVEDVIPQDEARKRLDDLWPAEWYVDATGDSRVAVERIPFKDTAATLKFTGRKKSIDGEPSWIHFWNLREVTPASAERIDSLWRKYELAD